MNVPLKLTADHDATGPQDMFAPEPDPQLLARKAMVPAVGVPAPMLKSADLERIFQVGSRTIRRWVDSERLPHPVRVGGVRRWQLADIQQVLHQLHSAASDS
jgi:predicted DNA-binding transcriptional regulator AlpA